MAPFTHSSAHTSLPSIHTDSSLLVVGPFTLPPHDTHLFVSADEEGLHFDAVAGRGHGGAGGDGGSIAGGGGDDGIGHPGTAQG